MTCAPHITKSTLNRRRRHLRTHHYALILLSTRQELVTLTKYRAYRPNAGKADPALGSISLVHPVYQTGAEAIKPPQSP